MTVNEAVQVYTAVSKIIQLNSGQPVSGPFDWLRQCVSSNVQPMIDIAKKQAEQREITVDEVIAEFGDREVPYSLPKINPNELPERVFPGVTDALAPVMNQPKGVDEKKLKALFEEQGKNGKKTKKSAKTKADEDRA